MQIVFRCVLLTCLFVWFSPAVFAQGSVAINTDGTAPHPNAMLDIKSTTKGLLLPRMTYAQRIAISQPPSGLMVYQSDNDPANEHTFGFYVVSGGGWRKIQAPVTAAAPTWYLNSADNNKQYSATDRVGIGIQSPTAQLHMRNTSMNQFLLEGAPAIINFRSLVNGSFVNAGRIYGSETDFVLGTGVGNASGMLRFEVAEGTRAQFEPDGTFKTKSDINLTTDNFTPRAFLQVAGNASRTDFRLGTVSGNTTGSIVLRTNGADAVLVNPAGDLVPRNNIQFVDGTTEKAFIQRAGDDLRLGTNSGNAIGNVFVRLNGANRFQFAQSGRLTLLADQNPTLYFNTGGVNRAYLQLNGDDIKIDAPGNKVRIGDDMTVDDATNRVTIPSGKLLNNAGENLLPVGFATCNASGVKISGTAGVTVAWGGATCYVGVNGMDISSATIIITGRNTSLTPSWTPNGERVAINFYDSDSNPLGPVGFSIVIYKTN